MQKKRKSKKITKIKYTKERSSSYNKKGELEPDLLSDFVKRQKDNSYKNKKYFLNINFTLILMILIIISLIFSSISIYNYINDLKNNSNHNLSNSLYNNSKENIPPDINDTINLPLDNITNSNSSPNITKSTGSSGGSGGGGSSNDETPSPIQTSAIINSVTNSILAPSQYVDVNKADRVLGAFNINVSIKPIIIGVMNFSIYKTSISNDPITNIYLYYENNTLAAVSVNETNGTIIFNNVRIPTGITSLIIKGSLPSSMNSSVFYIYSNLSDQWLQITDSSLNSIISPNVLLLLNNMTVANAFVSGDPQFLITASILASLKDKAISNTTQWQLFKSGLDNDLNSLSDAEGQYQGSSLASIANYALGYKILNGIDNVTASKYADRAIAEVLFGIRDYQKGGFNLREYVARGDGVTKQFDLPDSDVYTSSVKVWYSDIVNKTITKGIANGQDSVDYYSVFIKVSNTSDGNPDYIEGNDWRRNGDYAEDKLDWSLAGNEPSVGSTYYVTEASYSSVTTMTGWNLIGNHTLNFSTAPSSSQAIFVQYQYGNCSNGTTTLCYQHTGDGLGGLNSAYIDTTYPTRFLKYTAIGLDWLWDYPGLTPALKSEIGDVLIKWSDYIRDNGYYRNYPSSNYGAGHYALRMAIAITLQNRSYSNASRLLSEMQSYHDNYLLPILQAPGQGNASYKGGFWAEGWNYGPLAIRNVLTSGLAFEYAGYGNASIEKDWSNEVITSLLVQQSNQSIIFEGGDNYEWPKSFPTKDLIIDLSYLASNSSLKSYGNWIIQNYSGSFSYDWEDMIFRDPNATSVYWNNSLQLQYFSSGTGLVIGRKDWNYNSTWFSFIVGNHPAADHQMNAQGTLTINRGYDSLLVLAPSIFFAVFPWVNDYQSYNYKSKYSNLVIIDDLGAGEQTYRYSQGGWYGGSYPSVSMKYFEGDDNYTYAQGNYSAAYNHNSGIGNPAKELIRSIFYLREPDYIIVYDKVNTTYANYTKQLQWFSLGNTTLSNNYWSFTQGNSKLFGKTYSLTLINTTLSNITGGGYNFSWIITKNNVSINSVRYLTALQVTDNSRSLMDNSFNLSSNDGKFEGILIGAYVVMFNNYGNFSNNLTYNFNYSNGSILTHYVTDLPVNSSYNLTGAIESSANSSFSGILMFRTNGTGVSQNITISN